MSGSISLAPSPSRESPSPYLILNLPLPMTLRALRCTCFYCNANSTWFNKRTRVTLHTPYSGSEFSPQTSVPTIVSYFVNSRLNSATIRKVTIWKSPTSKLQNFQYAENILNELVQLPSTYISINLFNGSNISRTLQVTDPAKLREKKDKQCKTRCSSPYSQWRFPSAFPLLDV